MARLYHAVWYVSIHMSSLAIADRKSLPCHTNCTPSGDCALSASTFHQTSVHGSAFGAGLSSRGRRLHANTVQHPTSPAQAASSQSTSTSVSAADCRTPEAAKLLPLRRPTLSIGTTISMLHSLQYITKCPSAARLEAMRASRCSNGGFAGGVVRALKQS